MKRLMRKRISQAVVAAKAVKGSSLAHEDMLEVKHISAYKGRGVFAGKRIQKGSFICEYRGEKISIQEGEKRLLRSSTIDASHYDGKGKLINDSVRLKDSNCKPKIIDEHLCLFSVCDIEAGEELLFYYGETDSNMYWRLNFPFNYHTCSVSSTLQLPFIMSGEDDVEHETNEMSKVCEVDMKTAPQNVVTTPLSVPPTLQHPLMSGEDDDEHETNEMTKGKEVDLKTAPQKVVSTPLSVPPTLLHPLMSCEDDDEHETNEMSEENEVDWKTAPQKAVSTPLSVPPTLLHPLMSGEDDEHETNEMSEENEVDWKTAPQKAVSTPLSVPPTLLHPLMSGEDDEHETNEMSEENEVDWKTAPQKAVSIPLSVPPTLLHPLMSGEDDEHETNEMSEENEVDWKTAPQKAVSTPPSVPSTQEHPLMSGEDDDEHETNEMSEENEVDMKTAPQNAFTTTTSVLSTQQDPFMLSGEDDDELERNVISEENQVDWKTAPQNAVATPPSVSSTLQHPFMLLSEDDVDMAEDSASDVSEEVPCFPALCLPTIDHSDIEMDDSDKDPDYKPQCSDIDSSETEQEIHDYLVGEETPITDSCIGKETPIKIQVNHVSSSFPESKSTVAVEQRGDSFQKGQRDWKRKHTCFICNESVCDIPRHVMAKHPKEELVKQALSKPKGSKERRNIWRIIANKGTFKHNTKVRDIGGELHVFKRSSTSRKPEDYTACPYCYGYFLKKQLWRHGKKCHASIFLEKNVIQTSISSLATVMESAASSTKSTSQLFENFLDKMRKKDEVFILVKNDLLLSTYAKSLLEEGKGHSDISWTVRLLAKLLIRIRELSKTENYSWMELINTEHWDKIVNGIKALSEFKYYESGVFVEKPNIASKCGQGVKGLIAAYEGIALRRDDDNMLKHSEKMFKLFDREWAKTSKHCSNSIRTMKEDQIELLPLTSDIAKLKEKTVNEINRLVSEINDEPIADKYLMLSKLTVSRLITFNARRGGEPSKLRTKNWQDILEGSSIHQEELDTLPIEERKLAERLKLGYVKGKGARSKKVPIIFPEETITAINVLMQHREIFITNKSNPYIFARLYKNSMHSLRGSDCVREVCELAELQKPLLVTATKMRKYLATTLQLLDMKESELRWITDHLGHTVDVHKKWYRLSNRTVELTKVASILSASESGDLQTAHNVQFDNVRKETARNDSSIQNQTSSSQEPPYPNDDTHASFVAAQYEEDDDEHETNEMSKEKEVDMKTAPQNALNTTPSVPSTKQHPLMSGKGKKKQVHRVWSIEEKKALYSAFSSYLEGTRRQLPGKREICAAQTKFQILDKRSWLNIKFQLKNMQTKNK